MSALLNPYLRFRDGAESALRFYHGVFGGQLEMTTFARAGMGLPADAEKIMHGMVRSEVVALMAADVPTEMLPAASEDDDSVATGGNWPGVAISLSGDDAQALRGYWEGLSADGAVQVPLGPAPWGGDFGMCTDKFGVEWLVAIDSGI